MPVSELTAYWGSRVYDPVPNTHHKSNGREGPGAKAPRQRGDREEEVKFEPCVQVGGGVSRQEGAGERGERHQAEETQQGCVARSSVSPGWAGWAGVAETGWSSREKSGQRASPTPSDELDSVLLGQCFSTLAAHYDRLRSF